MSSRIRPAFYRVSQFLAAVKACLPVWVRGARDSLTTEDGTLIRSSLTTLPQQQLFARMSPNDRRHALAVVYTLRQAGHHNPALVQAALLHDVGKSAGQPLIHRVLIVLLEAFWPAALQRLSKPTAAASGRMIEDYHYVGDVSLEQELEERPDVDQDRLHGADGRLHVGHPVPERLDRRGDDRHHAGDDPGRD